MRLTYDFLIKVLPEAILLGACKNDLFFSIDSRTIVENELFVACKGGKVDGHIFLKEALMRGAGAIIALSKKHVLDEIEEKNIKNKYIIMVNDPQQALIKLAAAWRAQFTYPVVAITGSVGKTSTKTFAHFIFESMGKKALVSQGNFNTLLGVALTIMRMNSTHQAAFFEVGISKLGEMEKIAALLRPTVALLTWIGHSHMEGLGNLAAIAAEKRGILSYLSMDNVGIINGDQLLLTQVGYAHPIMKFGCKMINQIQARKIAIVGDTLSCVLKIYGEKYAVLLPFNHRGMLNNVLAAVAINYALGIAPIDIVQALKKLPVCAQRFQVCSLKNHKGVLIDDCYNASPESIKAALVALESMKNKGKKIVVLGDMLEMGKNAPFWHRQLGRFFKKTPSVSQLILIGSHVQHTARAVPLGVSVALYASWQEALEPVQSLLEDDVIVLVKGSRGMQLQHIVSAVVQKQ